jgi:dethiobiotin synthetase
LRTRAKATRSTRGPRVDGQGPRQPLYAFESPISPHLAAREKGTRIDVGEIERWVAGHEASITLIETAGALFSPLGHGLTNFDLMQSLRPDAAILVAPDRLGVLHELTTTLALAAARGGPEFAIVLSAPALADTSTGRNAREVAALGIGRVIAEFQRAPVRAARSGEAAERVIEWIRGRVAA